MAKAYEFLHLGHWLFLSFPQTNTFKLSSLAVDNASFGSGSYNHVRAFELQLNPGLIGALAQSKSDPHLTRISTLNLIIKTSVSVESDGAAKNVTK